MREGGRERSTLDNLGTKLRGRRVDRREDGGDVCRVSTSYRRQVPVERSGSGMARHLRPVQRLQTTDGRQVLLSRRKDLLQGGLLQVSSRCFVAYKGAVDQTLIRAI